MYEQLSNEYDDITFIKVDVDAAEVSCYHRSLTLFILSNSFDLVIYLLLNK